METHLFMGQLLGFVGQGKVPEGHEGAGKKYSYTGGRFYRIIHG